MKAYRHDEYGPPDVLHMQETATPTPGADEVLVKVHAVSLNAADWRAMRSDPFMVRFDTGLFKPRNGILGSDIAGRVEAIGTNVTQFKPGDEVYGDIGAGGFAEYVTTTEDKLALKPVNLSFEEAAAVPKAANTALQALRDKGRVQSGHMVLVNGASGGVGAFAVQIAKALGATVTGVSSTGSLDLVRSLGADHVLDYSKQDFATSGETYDLILDVAGTRSARDYLRALKPDGRAIIIGFTTLPHMLRTMLVGAIASRDGGKTITPVNAEINQRDLVVLKGMIEAGSLKPIIDRCYSFDEIPRAMTYLETGHPRGKVVIRMNREV